MWQPCDQRQSPHSRTGNQEHSVFMGCEVARPAWWAIPIPAGVEGPDIAGPLGRHPQGRRCAQPRSTDEVGVVSVASNENALAGLENRSCEATIRRAVRGSRSGQRPHPDHHPDRGSDLPGTLARHGIPASTLTDNGMAYTVRLAGRRRQEARTPSKPTSAAPTSSRRSGCVPNPSSRPPK